MGGKAYYNEHDKFCAEWLRNLVSAGLIAPGDVDDRDVRDVLPSDLAGYSQVHLFAGIGLWSLALRMAGWSDSRAVWTVSCPCQPFSQAGGGGGIFDDRHLWPAAFWLISQHAPCAIVGEQVASPDGLSWIDIVSSDLESLGYAVGPVDQSSAGVGAPNIRQRLFWVANTGRASGRAEHVDKPGLEVGWGAASRGTEWPGPGGAPGGLAIADGDGCGEGWGDHAAARDDLSGGCSADGGVADAGRDGWGEVRDNDGGDDGSISDATISAGGLGHAAGLRQSGIGGEKAAHGTNMADGEPAGGVGGSEGVGSSPGPRKPDAGYIEDQPERSGDDGGLGHAGNAGLPHTESFDLFGPRWRSKGRATEQSGGAPNPWREPEWVFCADQRWRPFESGAFPLAAGDTSGVARFRSFPLAPRKPGDVAKLRAYGNAINPWVAAEVIRAWMELLAL